MSKTVNVPAILGKPPTDNEYANFLWACAESGQKLDFWSFIAGRRLQAPWQEAKRAGEA